MSKFKLYPGQGIAQNVYRVDAVYGDDTLGNGSAEKPWKTLDYLNTFLATIVNTPATIIFGSGMYELATSPTVATNQKTYIGEGDVVITCTNASVNWVMSISTFKNIKFVGMDNSWNGGTNRVEFINCTFDDVTNFNYNPGSITTSATKLFKGCTFLNTNFITPNGSQEFINCVFSGCTGTLGRMNAQNCKIINCYFAANNSLTLTGLSSTTYTNTVFDYNCFENTTIRDSFTSLAAWTNLNSIVEANPFRDFDSTRFADTWKQDLSLVPTSLAATSGAGGIYKNYIGSKGISEVITTADIDLINSTNIQINAGGNAELISGTYGEILYNIVTFSELRYINTFSLAQNITYNGVTLQREQVADNTEDAAPDSLLNQKTTYDTEIKYSDDLVTDFATLPWINMEQNYFFGTDNLGNGSASDSFVPTSINTVIPVRRIQIKQIIRTY